MRNDHAMRVGDMVQVSWDGMHTLIHGRLTKLPSANAPYWEIYSEKGGGLGSFCNCAFSGTVIVSRLSETE